MTRGTGSRRAASAALRQAATAALRRAAAAALAGCLALPAAPAGAGGEDAFAHVVGMIEGERAALASLAPTEVAPRPKNKRSVRRVSASEKDLQCLARAIYHEARGEPRDGRRAVAEVVLNRVEHAEYPDTICGVVHDRRFGGCQFSWACMGVAPPRTGRVFVDAQSLAAEMIAERARPLTDGATHFHTTAIRPSWSRRLTRTAVIGSHVFYR